MLSNIFLFNPMCTQINFQNAIQKITYFTVSQSYFSAYHNMPCKNSPNILVILNSFPKHATRMN